MTTTTMGTPRRMLGIRRRGQATRRQHLPEQLLGARLLERHPTLADGCHRALGDVEDGDAQARLGQLERQGQAHMAAAADDHDVVAAPPWERGRTVVAMCCLSWIITLIGDLPYPSASTTWVR